MRVQLLLVPLLQAENHLARHNTLFSALELEVGIEGYLSGVFVDMGSDFTLVDVVLRNAVLETSHGSQRIQCSWMHLLPAIGDDANDNLLPAVLTPGSGTRS